MARIKACPICVARPGHISDARGLDTWDADLSVACVDHTAARSERHDDDGGEAEHSLHRRDAEEPLRLRNFLFVAEEVRRVSEQRTKEPWSIDVVDFLRRVERDGAIQFDSETRDPCVVPGASGAEMDELHIGDAMSENGKANSLPHGTLVDDGHLISSGVREDPRGGRGRAADGT